MLAASAIVGCGVIWRHMIRPVVKGIEELRERYDAIPELVEKVAAIDERTKQLEPNGGTSLYDRLSDVEKSQRNLVRKLEPMVPAIVALAGPQTARTREGDK